MKVIFLDIDGVLNVIPQGFDEYGAIFHKHFEHNLRRIIEDTGAFIVISSTWRHAGLDKMKEMWIKRDLPGEVIDITPDLTVQKKWGTLDYFDSPPRGKEIQFWLDKHPEVTNYVIIDDDSDMLPHQLNNYVMCFGNNDHTDCVDVGYGLTKECSNRVIEILNKL